MNKFVHNNHKTPEVLRYIDQLIICDNVRSISDLTMKDRWTLSAMILKTEPLTEILNFISQNDNDEKFKDLLVNCLLGNESSDQVFTIANCRFAEDYYEPMIESILNERLDDLTTF